MIEIKVDANDNDQRIDRFLKKYLNNATNSFIFKMLRKKNIVLNGKKVMPETKIYTGDEIRLYLSDDTLSKMRTSKDRIYRPGNINVIYEDANIILINKDSGILSHGDSSEYEDNVLDFMINYLIEKGEYTPRIQTNFRPALCNRLDRNTSGIIMGAKNYEALKFLNKSLREDKIDKYYLTIVYGSIDKPLRIKSTLKKDESKNIAIIGGGGKEIITEIYPVLNKGDYTILKIKLVTGRTHQIRSQLKNLKLPIVGDRKYGNNKINEIFRKKYDLNNQLLHAWRLEFGPMCPELEYLSGMKFEAKPGDLFNKILEDVKSGGI